MKRFFLVLTAVLCTTVNVMAQEVHGVESKMVCTAECNPNGSWDSWNSYGTTYRPWFGYEFTNLNSIPVSVEVELYHKESVKIGYDSYKTEFVLVATKSFVLKSGESYVFKTSESGISMYASKGAYLEEYYNKYFVKYKAYKLL